MLMLTVTRPSTLSGYEKEEQPKSDEGDVYDKEKARA